MEQLPGRAVIRDIRSQIQQELCQLTKSLITRHCSGVSVFIIFRIKGVKATSNSNDIRASIRQAWESDPSNDRPGPHPPSSSAPPSQQYDFLSPSVVLPLEEPRSHQRSLTGVWRVFSYLSNPLRLFRKEPPVVEFTSTPLILGEALMALSDPKSLEELLRDAQQSLSQTPLASQRRDVPVRVSSMTVPVGDVWTAKVSSSTYFVWAGDQAVNLTRCEDAGSIVDLCELIIDNEIQYNTGTGGSSGQDRFN